MAAAQVGSRMIEVEHLAKRFGDVMVLRDVSVAIKKGEVISIIGPSGTGKSTFLRCLNLLERPSGGRSTSRRRPLRRTPTWRIRQKMVYTRPSTSSLTLGWHHDRPINHGPRGRGEPNRSSCCGGRVRRRPPTSGRISGGIATCGNRSLSRHEPEIIPFDEPTRAGSTTVSEVLAVIGVSPGRDGGGDRHS
jgi:polar amino acid transport system ATP-binding protein